MQCHVRCQLKRNRFFKRFIEIIIFWNDYWILVYCVVICESDIVIYDKNLLFISIYIYTHTTSLLVLWGSINLLFWK